MFFVILCLLSLGGIVAYTVYRRKAGTSQPQGHAPLLMKIPAVIVYGMLTIIGLLSLLWTSVVIPSGGEIALMDRIYLCTPIKDGRNIALKGECGRQAEVIMPGFHFSPFIRVLNKIDPAPMINVPKGQYATLTAKDGVKLDEGQVAARPWPMGNNTFTNEDGKEVKGNMLDATFFLTDGRGRKGPQTTVLTPGLYPVNTYLWDVGIDARNVATSVEPGNVGVITSAIDDITIPAFFANKDEKINCSSDASIEQNVGQLKAVLVPVGCRGVWKEPLPSGQYFLNRDIYKITTVDTRLQNWAYKGGYKRRLIDLKIKEDGSIDQQESSDDVPNDPHAAGDVITVKVEGWSVYQELRIQARVKPEDAPLVVAAVGDMSQVEERIITPQVRSVLRNIGGSRITVKNTAAYEEAMSELATLKARLEVLRDPNTDNGMNSEQRATEIAELEKQIASFELPNPEEEVTRPTRVLDFQNERAALEELVAANVEQIGSEAGIEIVSVTLGHTDLPPELLVARKVEQLSGQLRKAYTQMRTAQVQRQTMESAKARADKQGELVAAQINVETSKLNIENRTNQGTAERRYLEEQALGQKAQTAVLGPKVVAQLRALDIIAKTLSDHPEILANLKLPNTVVMGGSDSGLGGLGAILGGTKLFGGPAGDTSSSNAK